MKSKAHMKKCLELGVSMSSVEDTEADEGGRENTQEALTYTTSSLLLTPGVALTSCCLVEFCLSLIVFGLEHSYRY